MGRYMRLVYNAVVRLFGAFARACMFLCAFVLMTHEIKEMRVDNVDAPLLPHFCIRIVCWHR